MSGKGFIKVEPKRKCEYCKLIRECRPYGPNGEQICITCAEKDIDTTEKMMGKYLFKDKDK